jgi:LysM repeat protein
VAVSANLPIRTKRQPDNRVSRPLIRRRLNAPLSLIAGLLPAFILGILIVGTAAASPAGLPATDRAGTIIQLVNQLRASYGLAAYRVDPILMAVAKKQNDWRVAANVLTHLGPDGSTPKERAAAAGYGGGGTIFISENIVDGTGLTPQEAVDWWKGDEPHLNTMIGAQYRDAGAAYGESGGYDRYTLMAGVALGGSSSAATAAVGQTPVAVAAPVIQASPLPDGSIIHIVEPGQTLWTIAAVYGVDVQTLLNLNGFSGTPVLHPGDRIVVKQGATATAAFASTKAASPTAPHQPSDYGLELSTSTAATAPEPSRSPTAAPVLHESAGTSNSVRNLLIASGLVLLLAGGLMAIRRQG